MLALLAGIAAVGFAQQDRVAALFAPAKSRAGMSPEPASDVRTVNVVSPTVNEAPTELTLPAQLLPFEQTSLHARVDGYVVRWFADRGARVRAGDVLAEIDAPELDQQTRQAEATLEQGRAALIQTRADLDQARADLQYALAQVKLFEAEKDFASRETARLRQAVPSGAAARSEYDSAVRSRDVAAAQIAAAQASAVAKEKSIASRTAAIGAQEATVRGLEANLQRLRELQAFKRIVAPFDGTVTRRNAEVGMLVVANSNQPSQELFHLQRSTTLRVQVDVPQRFAGQVHVARTGDVLIPENPDRPLTARVARTANALDPTTRTLRIELELPNADRAVLAGTYAQVRLRTPPARPTVLVPAASVRFTPQGVDVAVVLDDRVQIRPVTLGRDYGKSVEVVSGLEGGEKLVTNPTDDLQTGEHVRVAGDQPAERTGVALATQWPAAQPK